MSRNAEILSETQARAILKLAADDPPSVWRAAFQREVKSAHPDGGGDDEQVRLVLEAYRFLKTTEGTWRKGQRIQARPSPPPQSRPSRPQAQPKAEPQPEPEEAPGAESAAGPQARYRISVVEAFLGAEKDFRIKAGKRFKVRLPAGLQTGDVVRFGPAGEHRLTIQVTPLDGVELKGADLWITVRVSSEFLKEGGRMQVEHPVGKRNFWVSRTSASRGLFRAPGEGLPARANRPKGHLYLKFEHDPALDVKPAKSLLARFAKAWAAA